MKANELMIGDWVLLEGTPAKIVGVEIYCSNLYVQTNLKDAWYTSNFVEPIPLTKEILEKNEFKKDFELKGCYWRPDCRKYCIVKEIETWYFAFRHMGGGHICISECNYVHELQHALRLCKVDKAIVL